MVITTKVTPTSCEGDTYLNSLIYQFPDGIGWKDSDTVPGMHACPFNMFHNTGNQDIRAITYSIHPYFFSL